MIIKNQKLRGFIRTIYYWIYSRYYYILEILNPSIVDNPKSIPVIINNFNRITTLKMLIESLEKRNYLNIHIIDNASTYPPLLDYYGKCPYPVYRLKTNVGHLALWETDIYKKFIKHFYVYTDSDVVPIHECPDNFMEVFLKILLKHKYARKVGFSLKIDNLPDSFSGKNEVIEWERKYFENKVEDILYKAPIDTTFALYRPRSKGGANSTQVFRTAYPYEASHLPWYVDSNNLSEEEIYYITHAITSTMWTKKLDV